MNGKSGKRCTQMCVINIPDEKTTVRRVDIRIGDIYAQNRGGCISVSDTKMIVRNSREREHH